MSSAVEINEEMTAFLQVLDSTEETHLRNVPGLPGVWEVKYLKLGLEKGWIVVHHSGQGLALSADSDQLFNIMRLADHRAPRSQYQHLELPRPPAAWETF